MTTAEQARSIIEANCLKIDSQFTLSTGDKSGFYFDCKAITLNGRGLNLVSKLMLEEIDKLPVTPEAIGGLTMGADFMVAGVTMLAAQTGQETVLGSIVRKEAKKHGTKNKIENELPRGTKIVVVDDVITSGGSTLQACVEFEKEGYDIVGIIALVNREAGGLENLKMKYDNVSALFCASDFPSITDSHYEEPQKMSAS